MSAPKCDRCDEPIRPMILGGGLVPRLTGRVVHRTHDIQWQSVTERWMARTSAEAVQVTNTQVSLCDECWGGLLFWVNAPQQERAKLAAENRRYRERVEQVADERREKEVQRLLKKGAS